ncbi:hypothetical protein [Streptacidiphilus albus]|uniref:hypothetical protein n=1 Tax=Streptacidiphilus albus TaxID=105425 RepID=UPI00054B7738|nr:hypothetical protein [Streptacidiphilus albus]
MGETIGVLLSTGVLVFVVGLVGGTAPVRWVPAIKDMHRAEKVTCEVLGALLMLAGAALIFVALTAKTGDGSAAPEPVPSAAALSESPTPTPIQTPTPIAGPTPTAASVPSDSPSTGDSSAALTPVALAQISPVSHAENINVQEVKFGGTDYGQTWIESCVSTEENGPQYDTWDVSGYTKLTLTLGVPSDLPPSGVGAVARFTFTDNGKALTPTVTVSASQSRTLTIPLAGVDDLTIGCLDEPGPSEDPGGAVITFGLGNATLS